MYHSFQSEQFPSFLPNIFFSDSTVISSTFFWKTNDIGTNQMFVFTLLVFLSPIWYMLGSQPTL